MKQKVFIIIILLLALTQCSSPDVGKNDKVTHGNQLPRVLFITSGINNEESRLAQGITLAIQSFNKWGVIVRLEPRDILYRYEDLMNFNIVILSAFPGYHDADRKYSLSYMSDEEIHNLEKFVSAGGTLITGENVGRNYPDGTDRISVFKKLTPDNWEFSKCLGITLSEKNMTGFGLQGKIPDGSNWELTPSILSEDRELWTLVPDEVISENCKSLGTWVNRGNSLPAITENRYEKGQAYYLAFSGFLHPKNDGGYWSEDQIDSFYKYIIENYNRDKDIRFSLNPWPNGCDQAFCVSLNAEGSKDQYDRIFELLVREKVEPTIFVNGKVNKEIKDYLKLKPFPLGSNGYSFSNFSDLKYPQAAEDILKNENFWDINFNGFRFPFTNPGYWGLQALDVNQYNYESSIGANNLEFFHGSVVPYNLVIANDGFYKSTDILELAPTYHDDYYFLKSIKEDQNPDTLLLGKNVMVYRKYLENFWKYAVKPYKGLMVYLGHPQFVGYSDTTLSALKYIIQEVKKENTWITTTNNVADFRKKVSDLHFYSSSSERKQQIYIEAPQNTILNDVCLNFTERIKKVSAQKGDVKLIETANGSQVIFDAFNGQTLSIQYK